MSRRRWMAFDLWMTSLPIINTCGEAGRCTRDTSASVKMKSIKLSRSDAGRRRRARLGRHYVWSMLFWRSGRRCARRFGVNGRNYRGNREEWNNYRVFPRQPFDHGVYLFNIFNLKFIAWPITLRVIAKKSMSLGVRVACRNRIRSASRAETDRQRRSQLRFQQRARRWEKKYLRFNGAARRRIRLRRAAPAANGTENVKDKNVTYEAHNKTVKNNPTKFMSYNWYNFLRDEMLY